MQPEEFRVQVDPSGKGEVADRARAWQARFLSDTVIVRNFVTDLTLGEDFTDYPETHEMSRDEWAKRCGDYGLTVDGKPV